LGSRSRLGTGWELSGLCLGSIDQQDTLQVMSGWKLGSRSLLDMPMEL